MLEKIIKVFNEKIKNIKQPIFEENKFSNEIIDYIAQNFGNELVTTELLLDCYSFVKSYKLDENNKDIVNQILLNLIQLIYAKLKSVKKMMEYKDILTEDMIALCLNKLIIEHNKAAKDKDEKTLKILDSFMGDLNNFVNEIIENSTITITNIQLFSDLINFIIANKLTKQLDKIRELLIKTLENENKTSADYLTMIVYLDRYIHYLIKGGKFEWCKKFKTLIEKNLKFIEDNLDKLNDPWPIKSITLFEYLIRIIDFSMNKKEKNENGKQ